MMAADLQPFSIVEDPGFSRVMREADPRYIIPSSRYFFDVLIPQIHTTITSLGSQLLKSTQNSVTTVIWSSGYCHDSFMSLVAHFIVSDSFEKKSLMLSLWKFDESHTAGKISSSIYLIYSPGILRQK